jgi:hypothetical protein
LSHRLLRTILAEPWNWVALTLIAINPLFISQAYSSLTIMFGGTLVPAGIVTSLEVRTFRPWPWLLVGVMFGLAMLTRFQAAGFVIGAAMGLLAVNWVPAVRHCVDPEKEKLRVGRPRCGPIVPSRSSAYLLTAALILRSTFSFESRCLIPATGDCTR